MKLLLVAPTVDGTDVGEAWVAYQWVVRLAKRHDTTLLTYHKRDRPSASSQLSGLRVVEWVEPAVLGKAERLNSMLKPGYVPYYVRARRWVKDALARGERFDLAHQLVPVAMRYPSPVAGLGIPFLFGPVGGSLDSPPGFDDDDTSPWYVGLRALDRFRIANDPLLARTYEDAACVLGIAPYVAEFLAPRRLRRFEVLSETGIESLPPEVGERGDRAPVRLLYVGRVVRTKGLRDALRAVSLLPDPTAVHFDVVGDGFDRAACEELTAELGLRDIVEFHGTQPRAQVDDFYRDADVFVFPSYREPGGNVTFEAMSYGLPVVVADRGGPGNVVDESCGFRVHPGDPTQFAADLATAIERLVVDPSLRRDLGTAARRRVADIALWDRKVDRLEELYAELAGGTKPSGPES